MYKVELIKDCNYGKKGKMMNPMDKASYLYLYNKGLIEDEHNLVKEKKAKKEKTEKKETKKEEIKDNNN
tara:strand:+ start:264 stop:470 length:207 start_codon:yes stop_codon:yes gene_type:complete